MKNPVFLPVLFLALLFTSCTKDHIEPIQDTPEKAEARSAIDAVSNSFLSGSWHITSAMSSYTNLTANYESYDFSFATNGSLVAKENVGTGVVGKWTVSYVDSKTRVSFTFSSRSGFDMVNGDWTLLDGSTPAKMVMQRVTELHDYLTLEKQ